jgi:hypothetical protein
LNQLTPQSQSLSQRQIKMVIQVVFGKFKQTVGFGVACKKMTEGMSWDNIHLDHAKTISAFDLSDHEQLMDCCHYSNFQPLLAEVNISKIDKWNEQDEF